MNTSESNRSTNESSSNPTAPSRSPSQLTNNSSHRQKWGIINGVRRLYKKGKKFHFKNDGKKDIILYVFRYLSIGGLIMFGIIDTVMYSSQSNEKSNALQFIRGLRYIPIEISTIIYASGTVAFGMGIEIYILIPQAIVNAILIAQNCGGADELTNGIVWIIKLIFLCGSMELCYRNSRQLKDHKFNFNSSARCMLRQALIVSVTMIVENLAGVRALYRAVDIYQPHHCPYGTSQCGVIYSYEPLFKFDDDECYNDLSSYVAGREQLRILRNFILLNIVSYSVYNNNVLEIKTNKKHIIVRLTFIILLLTLITSTPIAYVDAPFFIKNCRLVYNIMEIIIFVIIVALLIFNLWRLRKHQENPPNDPEEMVDESEEMVKEPSLLP